MKKQTVSELKQEIQEICNAIGCDAELKASWILDKLSNLNDSYDKDFLTILSAKETARLLNVSYKTFRYMKPHLVPPAIIVGQCRKWRKGDVLKWLEERPIKNKDLSNE